MKSKPEIESLKLIVDFNIFKEQVEEFIADYNTLALATRMTNLLKENKKITDSNVDLYLQKSFNNNNNQFYRKFKYDSSANTKEAMKVETHRYFHLIGELKMLDKEIPFLRSEFKNKINILRRMLKHVELSDVILDKNINIEIRKNMKIDDIQDFILEKLYSVYDDMYYSIDKILTLNVIPLKRSTFGVELYKSLEKLEYVERDSEVEEIMIRITNQGAKYVEGLIDSKFRYGLELNSNANQHFIKLKEELTNLLTVDIDKCIVKLFEVLEDNSSCKKEVILIQGRHKEAKKKNLRGVISFDNSFLQINKIRESLLDLIESLNEKDIKKNTATNIKG